MQKFVYEQYQGRKKSQIKLISGHSEKGSLANCQYCHMLNKINCKPKKWRKSKKKRKSFNFLITEKLKISSINVGTRSELQ